MSATRADRFRGWLPPAAPAIAASRFLASVPASIAAALAAVVLLAAMAVPAAAQVSDTTRAGSLMERLGVDRLRLSTIGASGGVVKPAQIEPASLVSVSADYGQVVPGWRVVFSVTYWKSRYTDATVQRLADSLQGVIVDPTGDATVDIGRVRVSMVAVSSEARWSPRQGRRLVYRRVRPYVGGALGLYAVDAEGRGISGTFVESALDNIAAGVAGLAGGDILLFPNFTVGMQARYDLLSGARFGSLRVGGNYVFSARAGA
ncbi:MAG: hypothetical protein ACYC2G_03840 [Gemmatimonadaceae bacterium]